MHALARLQTKTGARMAPAFANACIFDRLARPAKRASHVSGGSLRRHPPTNVGGSLVCERLASFRVFPVSDLLRGGYLDHKDRCRATCRGHAQDDIVAERRLDFGLQVRQVVRCRWIFRDVLQGNPKIDVQ